MKIPRDTEVAMLLMAVKPKQDAELYQEAINLLYDEKEKLLHPIDMRTLDAVEGVVNMIL